MNANAPRGTTAQATKTAPGKPFRVLFACVGNSARSQMAEGFARKLAPHWDVRSGGSRPSGRVMPEAIAAMAEVGIDLGSHASKGFDQAWVRGCDLVVTMGCGDDACPAFAGRTIVDWALPDPVGNGLPMFREVRDDIERRIRALLATLD